MQPMYQSATLSTGCLINHWSYSTYKIMGVNLIGHPLKHLNVWRIDAFQCSVSDLNYGEVICYTFLLIFEESIEGK